MTRFTPEWIGASDDAAIPTRVRLRVFERVGGRCQRCGRKIVAGEPWQVDHVQALINGGEHRESNLRPLHERCHVAKTASDVKVKAKVARVKARHLGLAKSRNPMPGGKASRWKRTMSGLVVDRETGMPRGRSTE